MQDPGHFLAFSLQIHACSLERKCGDVAAVVLAAKHGDRLAVGPLAADVMDDLLEGLWGDDSIAVGHSE